MCDEDDGKRIAIAKAPPGGSSSVTPTEAASPAYLPLPSPPLLVLRLFRFLFHRRLAAPVAVSIHRLSLAHSLQPAGGREGGRLFELFWEMPQIPRPTLAQRVCVCVCVLLALTAIYC